MSLIFRSVAFAIVVFSATSQAYALGYKDIAGSWCDVLYTTSFSRNRVTLLPTDGRPMHYLIVTGYKFDADSVTVNTRGPNGPTQDWILTSPGRGQLRVGNDSVMTRCRTNHSQIRPRPKSN